MIRRVDSPSCEIVILAHLCALGATLSAASDNLDIGVRRIQGSRMRHGLTGAFH